VFYPDPPRKGAFYFEIEKRKDILSTTLGQNNCTKIIFNNEVGDLNINILFNYLEAMQMREQSIILKNFWHFCINCSSMPVDFFFFMVCNIFLQKIFNRNESKKNTLK